jgi:DNA repair protein RecO (recombination protein O)
MHLLRVSLDERENQDLAILIDTTIVHPRLHLVETLGPMEAAGHALRWIRTVAAPGTREPTLYATLNELLDALDDPSRGSPLPHLATGGLRILADIGFALVLDRCVRCGKPCPLDAPACLDPAYGGLVCRGCGGARMVVRSDLRARIGAAAAGDNLAMRDEDARIVIDLVDAVMGAHAAPIR